MSQRSRTPPGRFLWLVLLLGCPVPAAAQGATAAVLRGEVRDSTGVAVSGARVEIRTAEGQLLAGTVTDVAGRYMLLGLPSGGPYTLRVEHAEQSPVEQGGLHLAAGETRRIPFTLTARPIALPELRVAMAPDLTFSGTRTGAVTVIEERAVRSMPTLDRDIVAFAALSPMASIHEGAISVAGQNSRFNALRIDGALAQDVFGLSPSGVPGGQAKAKPLPLDAIRQYTVLIAPFDVRQAGFTGGMLNATTRSGGDVWSGHVFAYYRDAAFSGHVPEMQGPGPTPRGAMPDFRTQTGGFTLGGPLGPVRLLVAGEVERRYRPLPGLHLHQADAVRIGLDADSVTRLLDILETTHGFAPDDAGTYTLENPLGNLFVRLDAPLSARHDLTAHYNHIAAEDDIPAGRLGFGPYQLTSAATRLTSRTHSAMARLDSRLGDRTTNELLVNVQHTADATVAASEGPQVEVQMLAMVGGQVLRRFVQAGGDPLAHDNALDQRVIQVANSLSHARGDHLVTTGVEAAWFGVRRRHLPAARGIWRFHSLADLETNTPLTFERLVLADGADPAVEFGVLQLGTYVHDEWSVGNAWTLTLGARLDLPVPLARPGYNRDAEVTTGVITDRLPSANPMLSPRVGFNFTPATRRRTQLRGGVGLFAAFPPLAWIADAHADTGLRTRFVTCTDTFTDGGARIRIAPGITDGTPPEECLTNAVQVERDITFFAEDFRYPQDLRVSVGMDRELPWGLIATVDALYTRALHQVALEDVNLGSGNTGPLLLRDGYPEGIGPRPVFGAPRLVPTPFGPFETQRRWPEYGRVIRVGNRSRNAALAVATEVQRRFSDRLDFRLAYTYTRAIDTRSLLYQNASLNYGLTPVRSDPARPETQLSAFDRPHRVMGTVWSRLAPWGDGFDAALLYVGQSGLPYSYVYDTDMNGDGYPGPGAAAGAYNDLIYIPHDPSEISAGPASVAMLFQLAARDPCLAEARGRIHARNTCRAPWSNRLDLRLSQGLSLPAGTVRITGDILNVLNLLNPGWGLVQVAPPVVPIFRYDRRLSCPGLECRIGNPVIGDFTGPRHRDAVSGQLIADLPYVVSTPDSQWRAQLGIQVDF
jgi:hypothetical protein